MVEDSEEDAELTMEALEENDIEANVQLVTDGIQAMRFLRRTDEFKGETKPDIVLLDLNLPRKDGREVLEEIKMDLELRTIPVIVLSTSKAIDDVTTCYSNHANCFITKPVDLESFFSITRLIEEFWLKTVRLPGNYA